MRGFDDLVRSLAPDHPDYAGRYGGGVRRRDGAYHQGTVWGWLHGPYMEAVLRFGGAEFQPADSTDPGVMLFTSGDEMVIAAVKALEATISSSKADLALAVASHEKAEQDLDRAEELSGTSPLGKPHWFAPASSSVEKIRFCTKPFGVSGLGFSASSAVQLTSAAGDLR